MLTMEMVLHKDVDFAPKFGKSLEITLFICGFIYDKEFTFR